MDCLEYFASSLSHVEGRDALVRNFGTLAVAISGVARCHLYLSYFFLHPSRHRKKAKYLLLNEKSWYNAPCLAPIAQTLMRYAPFSPFFRGTFYS